MDKNPNTHIPGPWFIGKISGHWAVYHRERDPFSKFGTRRIVDVWASSERMAAESLETIRFENRAALAKAGA